MKNTLIIFISILLVSCLDNGMVSIPKEEYDKLRGEIPVPLYPKPWKLLITDDGINLATDGHEYIVESWDYNNSSFIHSPECIKCKNDSL